VVVEANPFVGTWRLVAWEMHDVQGQIRYPFGQMARGYLLYTNDGYMSAMLMAPDRRRFADGDLLRGDTAEQAAAAATYISYGGRYEVQGNTVVHHVEVSLFPNWVGSRQERAYTFSGDRLTLSTAPVLVQGSVEQAVLVWERVVPL
jgi:hypothetical protein